MPPPLSKTASASGATRQPTFWTRKRLAFAIGLIFLGGIVAAALDLRFVIGGSPRRAEPNSLLVLAARTMDTVRNSRGERAPAAQVVRGAGLVWTVDGSRNRLIGTNPESKRVFRDEVVGIDPVDAAVGFGAVWVANAGNGSVTRVPLASGARIETIGLEDQPSAIAAGAGYVWVVSKRGGKVIRIDPATKQVTKTVRLANPPLEAVARGADVFVTIGH